MTDHNVPPALRLRAAECAFAVAIKGIEIEDILDRLEALERAPTADLRSDEEHRRANEHLRKPSIWRAAPNRHAERPIDAVEHETDWHARSTGCRRTWMRSSPVRYCRRDLRS